MAYSKQNFQDGQILNAANLEAMENGIIAGQGAKNLLVNSDFRNPIDIDNKIGATNVNPCFTRWNFERANSNTTTQIIKIDNGIRIYKNGGVARFYQSCNYNLLGKTVSYAVGTTEGIFVGSCSVSTSSVYTRIGTHTGYLSVYQGSASEKAIFSLFFNDNTEDAIDLYWAALYEGAYTKDTLPDYVPKSIQQEMMDCGIPLYPKNLLKNSDFTNPSNVNRGMTSYSGAFYDIIDLWDCATPNGSTTTTELTSNGLKFTHSDGSSQIYLRQNVSNFWKNNKAYTTGIYKDDGTFSYSGYYNGGDGKINIVIPSGTTVASVVCYEGKYTEDMLPPYVPKGKHVEMLNCNIPLAPHNLLDNSDFTNPVNQRGITSQIGGGYGLDRWRADGNGTISVESTGISLTNLSFRQPVQLKAGTYTLAFHLSDGTTLRYIFKFDGSSTLNAIDSSQNETTGAYINYYKHATGVVMVQIVVAEGYTKIVEWAALYEGSYTADTLPPYQPKGYAAELAECRRYYKVIDVNVAPWLFEGKTLRRYYVGYEPMRTAPTVDVSGLKEYRIWTALESTINPYNIKNNRVLLSASAETTSTSLYIGGSIALCADL